LGGNLRHWKNGNYLHPSVLKPYFHLAFAQLQIAGDFDSPFPSEVLVEMELLLQFKHLLSRVRRSLAFLASPYSS
jgi:hypothetical protein